MDFYADRCGPCQALKPYLEGMEADYAGKVNFYQVDVDAEYQLAGEQ
ncbi:MAG: thioredoxin family protein [bacterium]